jgi:hypothetical protein
MPLEQLFGLLGAILVAIIIGFLLSFAITSGHEKSKSEETYEEDFENDGEIIETRAEVIDMACGIKMVGVKSPKTVERYIIVFRDDLGKTFEVPVNKEMYEGFEIGMHGNLKLVDGGLYSFEV